MFRNADFVQVVMGARCCGKASLIQLVCERIKGEGMPGWKPARLRALSIFSPIPMVHPFIRRVVTA